MKKRKSMVLLLTAAMTAGMLAGCAGASEKPSEAARKAAPDQSYVDEDGNTYKKFDDVKLKMLVCWNGGFKTAQDQYNNDVAAAIRKKIGVTVEFEGIMTDEAEKLNMMFASGDMPDMVNAPYWGGNSGTTAIIKKAGAENRLIDIRNMVPNYPNIADAYNIGIIGEKYLETDIDIPENNGARYVLPTEVAGDDADIQKWGYGVFVRGDVPKALGIDPDAVRTSDELYHFMTEARDYGFKDINGNDCIVATTFHNGWSYGDYTQNFDRKKLTGYSPDENGNVTYDSLSQDYIDKGLFIWKLVHEGILDKECFKTSDDRAKEKAGNGTALFTCAQYSVTVGATKLTGLYDSNPEMRYTWVGPLNYKDGSALKQIEPDGRNGSPVIIFPNTCSNIDAALTWLDYVNSKEGARLICYGFEGDTYDMNEDGQPRMNAKLTEKYKTDSESVKDELRERGVNYMADRTYVARKNAAWFGESAPFDADAENEYVKEYKKLRPVEKIPGYPVDAFAPAFDGYQDFAEWAFDDTTESEYRERAYFADTQDEATKILKDYQNYLRTNDGNKMEAYLAYLTEQSKTRDDIAY